MLIKDWEYLKNKLSIGHMALFINIYFELIRPKGEFSRCI